MSSSKIDIVYGYLRRLELARSDVIIINFYNMDTYEKILFDDLLSRGFIDIISQETYHKTTLVLSGKIIKVDLHSYMIRVTTEGKRHLESLMELYRL